MANTISDSSMEWLTENLSIWQHHKVGNFRYVNNDEAKRFQSIAKEIDSDRYFSIYACDKCIQELVRFVFENYEKQINGQIIEIKVSKEISKGTPTAKRKPRKKPESML